MYSFFYKIFKENCYDIVNYGDYGNPHTILIWLIDDLVAKEEIHMDLDFDVTMNSFDKFQSKLQTIICMELSKEQVELRHGI